MEARPASMPQTNAIYHEKSARPRRPEARVQRATRRAQVNIDIVQDELSDRYLRSLRRGSSPGTVKGGAFTLLLLLEKSEGASCVADLPDVASRWTHSRSGMFFFSDEAKRGEAKRSEASRTENNTDNPSHDCD